MGTIVSASKLKSDYLRKLNIPVIFCSYSSWIDEIVKQAGFSPYNLNIMLAEVLMHYPTSQRNQRAADGIMKIASGFTTPVFLDDYQILFDPRYHIDPINVFWQISRRQRVAVRWHGSLIGNSLQYAEPGCPDYASFNIENCDILCIN